MNKRKARKAARKLQAMRTNVPPQIQYTNWFRSFCDNMNDLNKALEDKKVTSKKATKAEVPKDPQEPDKPVCLNCGADDLTFNEEEDMVVCGACPSTWESIESYHQEKADATPGEVPQ